MDDAGETTASGSKATASAADSKLFTERVSDRKTLRTRFTKKINELEASLSHLATREEKAELVDREWDLIESVYEQIKKEDEIINPLLLTCSPAQFDDAMERVFKYEDEYYRLFHEIKRVRSKKEVASISGASAPPVQSVSSTASHNPMMKYFKVPKFSGDYKKFREWWQMFDAHVHKKAIDPVEKYSLLKQSLEGRAAAEIAHLEFTADQYQVAMDAIAAKFGSAKDAEKEHVQQLQRLVLTRDLHVHDKFISFVSALSQNVKALISLGKNYDSLSLMLTPNILSALPVQ
ncbi:uncharacterized protein LOC108865226, partial [Galendromus occidentalis]|uniref:Uncharacterized protein LOC108865226 n=1 Tax=Galendromus occidentalis TaxID=34638 RepID=A0AAJ7PB32_9ACAR